MVDSSYNLSDRKLLVDFVPLKHSFAGSSGLKHVVRGLVSLWNEDDRLTWHVAFITLVRGRWSEVGAFSVAVNVSHHMWNIPLLVKNNFNVKN